MTEHRYGLTVAPVAGTHLTQKLSESVAFAAYEFIVGPLLDDPHRAGTPLRALLSDRRSARRGTYRVVYRIDGDRREVIILGVFGRDDATRPRPAMSIDDAS